MTSFRRRSKTPSPSPLRKPDVYVMGQRFGHTGDGYEVAIKAGTFRRHTLRDAIVAWLEFGRPSPPATSKHVVLVKRTLARRSGGVATTQAWARAYVNSPLGPILFDPMHRDAPVIAAEQPPFDVLGHTFWDQVLTGVANHRMDTTWLWGFSVAPCTDADVATALHDAVQADRPCVEFLRRRLAQTAEERRVSHRPEKAPEAPTRFIWSLRLAPAYNPSSRSYTSHVIVAESEVAARAKAHCLSECRVLEDLEGNEIRRAGDGTGCLERTNEGACVWADPAFTSCTILGPALPETPSGIVSSSFVE